MTDATSPATPFDFAAASRTVAQIQEEMKDHVVMPGRTRGDLQAAFDLVKDRTDWKMPIRATLPTDTDHAQLALIEDAVIFFTGGTIEVDRTAEAVVVTSEGYYINIGS